MEKIEKFMERGKYVRVNCMESDRDRDREKERVREKEKKRRERKKMSEGKETFNTESNRNTERRGK